MREKSGGTRIIAQSCSPDLRRLRAIVAEAHRRLQGRLGFGDRPEIETREPSDLRGLSVRRLCHEAFKATCSTRPNKYDPHKQYGNCQ